MWLFLTRILNYPASRLQSIPGLSTWKWSKDLHCEEQLGVFPMSHPETRKRFSSECAEAAHESNKSISRRKLKINLLILTLDSRSSLIVINSMLLLERHTHNSSRATPNFNCSGAMAVTTNSQTLKSPKPRDTARTPPQTYQALIRPSPDCCDGWNCLWLNSVSSW